jgi:hypothetical protein
MIYQIGEHRYTPLAKASYATKQAEQYIFNAYYRKYLPSGYFNSDGTLCLYTTEGIKAERNEDGKYEPEVKPMQLDELQLQTIYSRLSRDAGYINEMLDFHCIPVGRSPLLSIYLEDYTPTEEEKGFIEEMQSFFLSNGVGKTPKKPDSTESTTSPSPASETATAGMTEVNG